MKLRENSMLELQTAGSGMIIISKEPDYDDYSDEEGFYYSIKETEGYGGYYWSFSHLNSPIDCIDYLENSDNYHSQDRSNLSWWLNYPPIFVDDPIKHILKSKLEAYYFTGEIKNAFINSKYAFERNPNNLIEWHELLQVNFKNEFLNLIPTDNSVPVKNTLTIQFEGFQTIPFYKISIKLDLLNNFQTLLNYIFSFIKGEISPLTYSEKWILYNNSSNVILTKEDNSSNLTLSELGIQLNDKLVCYKK